jgi:Uma2 family endonuclease
MTDAASPSSKRYSWDDFLALDDDDRRELIDGELVEVEVTNGSHEYIVALLIFFIGGWAHTGRRGHVLGSGYKVRIDDRRGVMPDVQFFRASNRAYGQYEGLAHGRPDLAVEVISPSSRRYDRVKKLGWYARIGVPEYWIVDADARTVERLVLSRGRYVVDGSAEGDATFAPKTLAGLAIPRAELWAFPGKKRRRKKASA